MNYYDIKKLSVSSVRLFAQNPLRALDDWNGTFSWFTNKDALLFGSVVHAYMESFISGNDDAVNELKENNDDLYKKDGKLYQKYADAITVVERLQENESVRWIKEQTKKRKVLVEPAFFGTLNGVEIKGKLDVVVIDEEKKKLYFFDYKTSKSYDVSGYDWGETIDGERLLSHVAIHKEKMFHWQGAVYQELLKQNGYEDYKIYCTFIVATKEKEPRIDIFKMKQSILKVGLKEFEIALKNADDIISGRKEAEMVVENSQWYNQKTSKKGNVHSITAMSTILS